MAHILEAFEMFGISSWDEMIGSSEHSIEEICSPCRIKYDFIGNTNTLDDDLVQLEEDLFGKAKEKQSKQLVHFNCWSSCQDNSNRTVLPKSQQNGTRPRIPKSLQEQLKKIYGNDLAMFAFE